MKLAGRVFLIVLAALLWGKAAGIGAVFPNQWAQAAGTRSWNFPRDHGAHPDYRTEWWYFTGNLVDTEGGRYGYQLTFFRQGIQKELKNNRNQWLVRDVYLAHFAIADIDQKSFWFSEQASRSGPGLAGAKLNSMAVWCLKWSARMEKNRIFLAAGRGDVTLNLELVPRKPAVFHGENGLSRKGALPGQASWYYSFTDLETKGTIKTKGVQKAFPVSGTSWFDQEFGSNQLSPEQLGWDWFALHLSDGRELMLYLMRKKDGTIEPSSSGTLIEKNGRFRHLDIGDIRLEVLDHWESRQSGGRYPAQWRIRVPSAEIDLAVSQLLADQELNTAGSTGVTYYEGAIGGKGTSFRRPITCEGYVEMTGYAGALGGLI